MSLKSRFLTLSIKEQIFITILVLTFFCLLALLGICCSLSYEFLKEDYRVKKSYFYNKYRKYIEISFYFQNFCLLKYEEIIRRMQKQSFEFYQSLNNYDSSLFEDCSHLVIYYHDSLHKNIMDTIDKNYPILYFLCFWEPGDSSDQFKNIPTLNFCTGMWAITIKKYQSMANSIIFHDIYDFFRIPGYDVPIINSPLFTNVNYSSIFSFNASKIHNKLIEVQGNSSYIEHDKLRNYFHYKINEIVSRINNSDILYYLSKNIDYFDNMFLKINNEIKSSISGPIENNQNLLYGHLSIISYSNNIFSLINKGIDNNYFYCETNIIENYMYFLHDKLLKYLNINFISFFKENNTILSEELCLLFILKQFGFQIDNNTFNELYYEIKRGNSILEDCFINKDIINTQSKINDILKLNITNFLDISSLLYQGLIKLSFDKNDFPFFFMKYPYPNYNVLKDFRSDYLLLDQVNFYIYASFKVPIKYCNHIFQISQNCFFFIILTIVYIWFICLYINLFIFSRVINDLINPILKLQDAIESNTIKDENIFIYKNDDTINELFGTCKELLSGQINNKENGLMNFNILNKDKQKKIDENKYKKNLIINNEIMNKLICEQQNMMDFSNNIKVNDINDINDNYNENTEKNDKKKLKNVNDEDHLISEEDYLNSNLDKDSNKKIKFNIKKCIDNSDEKDNEPYKKLFQISEYLYYYRTKLKNNNIIIINNNSIIDESKMSKIISKNSKNLNNSMKTNTKKIKINEYDDNENIHINMLDEENISYLWYMSAKKKHNKSFNYKINENYNELFMDYNDNNNYKYDEKIKSNVKK